MAVVDIDLVPREHAILSASSAERWLVCTPSARIEEEIVNRTGDTGSIYATDGTAAHAFAEVRLRMLLEQITKAEYKAAYAALKVQHAAITEAWVTTDWDAIDRYVEYVMAEAARLDATVYIEARVDYSTYAESGFGTSDALLVSETHHTIKSIDLKFGKGVPVSARNNVQAKLYALGGLLKYDPDHVITKVEWAIAQTRLDYIGEDGTSVVNLIEWAEKVVAPAAELAWKGEGPLKPTPKGCRFCKAAPTCRARAAENVLIARRDFMSHPDVSQMDMEEIAQILPDLDSWINWANTMRSYALEQVRDHGAEIPGYKLVRGRANRAWRPGVDVADTLKSLGIPDASIYEEPSVRSVAQMEKQLGKAEFGKLEPTLVHKPLGTPALVPLDDPREGIDKAGEARASFGIDKQ